MKNKTIRLNMIVKNESAAIRCCLESVKELIDVWVIVDTGSTDQTKEITTDALRGIPGKLYERPWIDFAHNRNEALQLALGMGDYLLFLDADEELIILDGFEKQSLTSDAYLVRTRGAHTDHFRILLARSDPA